MEQHFRDSLSDDHWKRVRATISPAFNTSRLKRMYRHIHNTADQFLEFIKGKQEAGEPVELKECCSQYTLDVIAQSGFGLQVWDSHNYDL